MAFARNWGLTSEADYLISAVGLVNIFGGFLTEYKKSRFAERMTANDKGSSYMICLMV